MFYVYIIQSVNSQKLYKGHCQELETRLKQHNTGLTKSTRSGIPWKIVWYEEHPSLESAINREKYLKTAAGRRFIKFKLYLPTVLVP